MAEAQPIEARLSETQTVANGSSVTLWADLSGIASEPTQKEPAAFGAEPSEPVVNDSSESCRQTKP